MHRVAVAAHDAGCRRHVIGDDTVTAFARDLRRRIGDQVFGFGGEADDETWALFNTLRDRRKNVGVLCEFNIRNAAAKTKGW